MFFNNRILLEFILDVLSKNSINKVITLKKGYKNIKKTLCYYQKRWFLYLRRVNLWSLSFKKVQR